jgi:hypothetical protein
MTLVELILVAVGTVALAVVTILLTGWMLISRRTLHGARPAASVMVVYVGTGAIAVLLFLVMGTIVDEAGIEAIPPALLSCISLIELIFIINAGRVVHLSEKRDRSHETLSEVSAELDQALSQPEIDPVKRFFMRLQKELIRLVSDGLTTRKG